MVQAEEDGALWVTVSGTPEDCTCTISGYRSGLDEPLFTVTREKNAPLADATVEYSVAQEEEVPSEESIEIDGSTVNNVKTVTVTKDDEFVTSQLQWRRHLRPRHR